MLIFYTVLWITTLRNDDAFIEGFTWSRVVNFKTNLPKS